MLIMAQYNIHQYVQYCHLVSEPVQLIYFKKRERKKRRVAKTANKNVGLRELHCVH